MLQAAPRSLQGGHPISFFSTMSTLAKALLPSTSSMDSEPVAIDR